MTPDLSIIIVSWNTRDLLRGCLASLPEATGGLGTEVIVVDNASVDGSADMVRQEFPACLLIESGGNLGFSRGNNLGLARAAGATVLLLNPDTVCPPGSLQRLHEYLAGRAQAGVVGPTLVDERGEAILTYGNFPAARYHWLNLLDPRRTWLPAAWREARFGCAPTPGQASGPVGYVMGACLMTRREVLERVGPLDERFFMYFEETDFCWRVRQAGWQVHHLAEVEVVHLEGRAAGQVSRFSLEQFQHSYRQFVAKNYGPGQVWRFRLAQLAEFTGKGLLRLLGSFSSDGNRRLAGQFLTIARLQLRGRLDPLPPGSPPE